MFTFCDNLGVCTREKHFWRGRRSFMTIKMEVWYLLKTFVLNQVFFIGIKDGEKEAEK